MNSCNKKIFFTLLLQFIFMNSIQAQSCFIYPGSSPFNPIPVCGTVAFRQPAIINCGGPFLATAICGKGWPLGSDRGGLTTDRSYWYRFTCFQSGTLGFLITSDLSTDDYDWALLDITGRNPAEIFTNDTLRVSLNTYGKKSLPFPPPPNPLAPFPKSPTGCIPGGIGDVHCFGDDPDNSPFNRMPDIIAGHIYLLMITNWAKFDAGGYGLLFTGGTASITNPLLPKLTSTLMLCNATQISVKFNKKMKCSSLAADGSDFSINIAGNNIVGATGAGCSNGFDIDSAILTMRNPMVPGTYIITVAKGSDGNTVGDVCDVQVPAGENIPVTIFPVTPTPMDSITKPGCSPSMLELVFSKNILCSSIAADGSDFVVTGPATVTVTGAKGDCETDTSGKIFIQLSSMLQVGGVYTVLLKTGSDGNTIMDECSQQTPAGSVINFTVSDTVNAQFSHNITYGCERNTVQYFHNGVNGVNNWRWSFDNKYQSIGQNPVMAYSNFQNKNTVLIVSNGVCNDTAAASIVFENLLNASFEGSSYVCPVDPATFIDKSEGTVSNWLWSFGNGITSTQKKPPMQYYKVFNVTRDERITLIAGNRFGCFDTATAFIKVVNNCAVEVPSAFTPNGDGLNDYLFPINAYKAKELSFDVYNRLGQRIFFTTDRTKKWDGTFRGQPLDTGTYVWLLMYTNTETNLKVIKKGTVILLR